MKKKNQKNRLIKLQKRLKTRHASKPKSAPKLKPLLKSKPLHPWRLCPVVEHWVREHPLRMPSTLDSKFLKFDQFHLTLLTSLLLGHVGVGLFSLVDALLPSLSETAETLIPVY